MGLKKLLLLKAIKNKNPYYYKFLSIIPCNQLLSISTRIEKSAYVFNIAFSIGA